MVQGIWRWLRRGFAEPVAAVQAPANPPGLFLSPADYKPQRFLKLDLAFDYCPDPPISPRERSCHSLRILWFWLDPAGLSVVFAGHCSLTGQFGLFHSEGISNVIDGASGATVPDLRSLLLSHYGQTLQGRMEQLQERHRDELSVLLYAAQADGLLQDREKQFIASYLLTRAAVKDIQAEDLAPQLRWLGMPSEPEFRRAVQRLGGLDRRLALELVEACEAVIDVKPSRDGQEQAALDYIRSQLLEG